MTEPIGYAAAQAELEEILAELEGEDVDIDLLTQRVRRAAELIRLLRERIGAARMEVDQIVAGLEEPAGGESAAQS